MVRHPVDRLISEYFYCQQTTGICGQDVIENTTITDRARTVGSMFFRQLLSHRGSCHVPFNNYAQFSNQILGLGKWRDHNSLRAPYATQRSALLDYFIDNLEDWFAVFGITAFLCQLLKKFINFHLQNYTKVLKMRVR